MGKEIIAGRVDEIRNGSLREVTANGFSILLARINDSFYATDNHCPHAGGNLSRGTLEGTVITCPRHGSRFDLKDGSVKGWLSGSKILSIAGKIIKPSVPLKTYEVSIREDKVIITLP